MVRQISRVHRGSRQLPALSPAPATVPQPSGPPLILPTLLNLSSPGWGDVKAAPRTGYPSTREALLKISVSFFFFFLNNEAKIKILYFHYSLFSQPAEQKHKALLLLPLAPWTCLFSPAEFKLKKSEN